MLTVAEDPKGFVRLKIQGKITAAEMESGIEAFLAQVESRPKTNFLYEITDFAFPTERVG